MTAPRAVRLVFSFGAAILLAALASSSALAGDDAQTICEGNGGRWVGSGGSPTTTGYCTLPANNPVTLATCAPGETLEQYWEADALLAENCFVKDPTTSTNEVDCMYSLGGVWAAESNGYSCTVAHDYLGDCPAGQTTTYYYDLSYDFVNYTCSGGGNGNGSSLRNPGYGKHGGKIKDDGSGSAHLGGNRNGSFYYNAGTCAGGCIFTPNLPGGAAASLPADAVATLYIRIADGGTGSYTVCFDAIGMSNPVIYQYVSGAWVALPVFFSGGQVCATASGDGAFALGGS
ncbi:MAG: hypothetical protein HYZ26_07660 [Chloroflexi bacterium]|nr:hypothetical protein [Chloroflexota bacterium]